MRPQVRGNLEKSDPARCGLNRGDKQVKEEFQSEVVRAHRRQSTGEQSREDSKEGWGIRKVGMMWKCFTELDSRQESSNFPKD